MISSAVVTLLLASAAIAQSPPGFTPSTSERLLAAFDSAATGEPAASYFTPGGVYSRSATNITAPRLFLQSNQTNLGTGGTPPTYILCMVDPDAPSPLNNSNSQILHWVQQGLRPLSSNSSTTDSQIVARSGNADVPALIPYRGPAPPSVEPHRYILLLFRQPDSNNFVQPAAFAQFNNAMRSKFDAARWAEAAGLGAPVAATWFLVGSNTTGDGTLTPGGVPPVDMPTPTSPPTSTPTNAAAKTGSKVGLTLALAGLGMLFSLM